MTFIREDNIDTHAESLTDALLSAAKASIPTSRTKRWSLGRQPWWNDDLSKTRKELNKLKRQDIMNSDRAAYNRVRNNNLQEIRHAKTAAWITFSEDLNTNVWGKTFKHAKKGPSKIPVQCTIRK